MAISARLEMRELEISKGLVILMLLGVEDAAKRVEIVAVVGVVDLAAAEWCANKDSREGANP